MISQIKDFAIEFNLQNLEKNYQELIRMAEEKNMTYKEFLLNIFLDEYKFKTNYMKSSI